ncbi:MAG TPA: hypothetical protein VFE63_04270, partial [Roseiarcus sp.]|nr:hypothetical protein [Roseiarcus sp.]
SRKSAFGPRRRSSARAFLFASQVRASQKLRSGRRWTRRPALRPSAQGILGGLAAARSRRFWRWRSHPRGFAAARRLRRFPRLSRRLRLFPRLSRRWRGVRTRLRGDFAFGLMPVLVVSAVHLSFIHPDGEGATSHPLDMVGVAFIFVFVFIHRSTSLKLPYS